MPLSGGEGGGRRGDTAMFHTDKSLDSQDNYTGRKILDKYLFSRLVHQSDLLKSLNQGISDQEA